MARPLRIEFPGAMYHVTSRGDRRENIYESDSDRRDFLNILAGVVKRFDWVCRAYCLMDNHYHLLIETPRGNLSRGMRQLNGLYTQRLNRRRQRSGHVFQGRFKSILVEKEPHGLELCRYIVLNPVRAGLVDRPEDWPWSSYPGTSGLSKRPEFLKTEWILDQFGPGLAEARKHYRKFVGEGKDLPSPWPHLVGGFILGGEEFIADCRAKSTSGSVSKEIPQWERGPGRPDLATLFAPCRGKKERNAAMGEAYLRHGYRMKELADFLHVHYATVSRAVKSVELQMIDCQT